MIFLVPVMFIITLTMTIIGMAEQNRQDLQMSNTIAGDFAMVHEWRVNHVEMNAITDGEITITPGYPFVPFYDYYTEVHETNEFIAVVSWPEGSVGSIVLDERGERDLLASLEGRVNRGFFIGNFTSYGPGAGGRVVSFDLIGLDVEPEDGDPVLLKIFTKETPA